MPEVEGAAVGGVVTTTEYGLALAEPSAADARDEPGLVVIEVRSGPAAHAGLRPDDVVRSINGLELYDTSDFMDAVESTYSGAPVVLQVERKGRLRLVNLHRAYGPGLTGPGRNSPAEQFDMLRDIQRQYNRNAQDIIDSVGR